MSPVMHTRGNPSGTPPRTNLTEHNNMMLGSHESHSNEKHENHTLNHKTETSPECIHLHAWRTAANNELRTFAANAPLETFATSAASPVDARPLPPVPDATAALKLPDSRTPGLLSGPRSSAFQTSRIPWLAEITVRVRTALATPSQCATYTVVSMVSGGGDPQCLT